ncbi:ribbon-helix-helix protein, CopG family [Candidatus Palauibacter sp.]|uniref:ribbon-helix-helix protein, CopG family n=1 Tax=Candidatus Palauibacter sp. TaxID=3101350 RepID=UPI003C6FB7FF
MVHVVILFTMRTTISLDDQLARQVRREAAARGMSVSAFIAKTLDAELKRRDRAVPPPFRLVTVRSRLRPGVDLDRPGALDAEDDKTRFGSG